MAVGVGFGRERERGEAPLPPRAPRTANKLRYIVGRGQVAFHRGPLVSPPRRDRHLHPVNLVQREFFIDNLLVRVLYID